MKRLTALALTAAMLLALSGCIASMLPEQKLPESGGTQYEPSPAPLPEIFQGDVQQPGPAPVEVPSFTAETLPRLDGSTATIPLSEGIVQALLGYTPAQATQFVKHNKTHNAYVNLTEGKCDIIFVTPPSQEELALLDGSNVVFKLLGPILVKQELGEAQATVGKRLDYITAEIK